jgi:hypothetical protein
MKGKTRNKRKTRKAHNTRKTRCATKYGGYAYETPKYSADTPRGLHKKGEKKRK